MKVGEILNGYGTPVSLHRCCYCWDSFAVTPAVTEEEWGLGCASPECPSYDITRDVEIGFEDALAAGWIRRGSP